MGFCTTINPYTGREVLCCDLCGAYRGKTGIKFVRKKQCPFGYCQAYATCNNCWKSNNKEIHIKNKCDIHSAEYDKKEAEKNELLLNGEWLNFSNSGEETYVKMWFRNKENQEKLLHVDRVIFKRLFKFEKHLTLKEILLECEKENLLPEEQYVKKKKDVCAISPKKRNGREVRYVFVLYEDEDYLIECNKRKLIPLQNYQYNRGISI